MSIEELCERAVRASRALTKTTAAQRSAGLLQIANAIEARASTILQANALDLQRAVGGGLSAAMIDRLKLDEGRISDLSQAVRDVAEIDDLIGHTVSENRRPNGLLVSRVRIPLGVVAMIFESRPNVTSDAASLCLRSCNAVILRGGKEALESNKALGNAIRIGLAKADLPIDAVQVFATTDRSAMHELLQQEDSVDLVIPRGGEGLIRYVSENSRIPVIKHYKGVCHVYVHEAADLQMACDIAVNAKASRPGVCNAAETILVDESIASVFVPMVCAALAKAGVEIRGDERTKGLSGIPVALATEEDWQAEYLDTIVAMRVVGDFEAAVAHIQRFGSNHTEAIISADSSVTEQFRAVVHSSTVVVNASTRFADGGELGLGAEIGISTTKLHAYGPMGAEGLTAIKFVVQGDGQVRR
ncbi:MAG: glutamate-5-semialdehyde dehydrogenase [Myxococcales bacterium]|nr:glutamate-5-semialdehyde dehydrogenase [Myxococcales bacterium]